MRGAKCKLLRRIRDHRFSKSGREYRRFPSGQIIREEGQRIYRQMKKVLRGQHVLYDFEKVV